MDSRNAFECVCKAFVDKHARSDDDVFGGWTWNEHPNYPHLGYLARRTTASRPTLSEVKGEDSESEDVSEESDAASVAPSVVRNDVLEVWQSIVYSVTFQVPVFYFSVHTTSGSPVALDDMLKSSLFRRNAFPDAETRKTSFGLGTGRHTFPLLSQGEHPTLGTPCWFLHPCETHGALAELVEEADGRVGQLELWLLLVGNVITCII